jgi:hypothetical protein
LTSAKVLSNAVLMTWTAPASGGAPVSYTIESSPAGANTWTSAASGILPCAYGNGTIVLQGIAVGLSASTSYDFRCAAVNASGSGAPSSTVSSSTAATGALPSVPTLTTTSVGSYMVLVDWPDSTNSPLCYRIEYCPTGSGAWVEEALSSDNTWDASHTANSHTRCVYFPSSPSTTFDFRVRALNANGISAYSATVSGSTLARLAVTNAPTVSGYGWTGDDHTTEDPATAAAYVGGTSYVVGNVVTSSGSAYMALAPTTGNVPPNASFWRPIATTVYYISAAGSDSNNGTSAATPWLTVKKIREKITAGYITTGAPTNTLFLFRRGDTFDDVIYVQNGTSDYMFGSYGTGANAMPRIKWDTYDATWQNRNSVFCNLAGKSIIKHLALESGTNGQTVLGVIYVLNSAAQADRAINIHSVELRGASNCGIRGDDGFNWLVDNCFIVKNGTGINGLDNFGHQFLNTTLDGNGNSTTFDHNIYISTAARITVRGCLMNNISQNGGNYGLVAHGACSELVIDQNKFTGCNNGIGISNGYLAGISLVSAKEFFAGTQVTRNIVENSGKGTGQTQGFGMIIDSMVDSIIENNTFRNNSYDDISVSYSAGSPDDVQVSNVTIANNSFSSTSTNSNCVQIQSAGTTGIKIQNNAMYMASAGAFAVTTGGVAAAEVTLDHNQYYNATGTTHMFSWLGTNYASLAAFKAAVAGKEAGSAEGNPNFTNTTGDFTISGAPCRSAGASITDVTVDIVGTSRSGTTPSIGAYE